jgi:hypothetical protein
MPPFRGMSGLGAAQSTGGLRGVLARRVTWEKTRVAVAYVRQGDRVLRTTEIDGSRLGHFSLHPNIDKDQGRGEGGWTLTHAPTGWRLCTCNAEGDARKIGETLHAANLDSFSQEDVSAVVEDCPPWVGPWLKACRQARAFVPLLQRGS